MTQSPASPVLSGPKQIDVAEFGRDIVAQSTAGIGTTWAIAVPDTGPQRLMARVLDVPRGDLTGTTLIVALHGRVNRLTMTLPAFDGRFILRAPGRRSALVLTFSDPSLSMADDLEVCFFAGNHQGNTPAQLIASVKSVVDAVKPARLVLVGGSSGAYATIILSCQFDDSIAVVCNPLLNIPAYNQATTLRYYEACWPSLSKTEIESRIVTDAGALLSPDAGGRIIWLQNATDHHISRQTLPAISRLPDSKKLLYASSFLPGIIGHNFDPSIWGLWVQAAAEAPESDLYSVGEYFVHLQKRGAPGSKTRPGSETALDPKQIKQAASIAALAKETLS